MSRSGILTLTTDFGNEGPYVAAMKGVVLVMRPGRRSWTFRTRSPLKTCSKGRLCSADIVAAFPERDGPPRRGRSGCGERSAG